MGKRKKPTEQELKDRLWAIVKELDFAQGEDLSCIDASTKEYTSWCRAMESVTLEPHKVDGFTASNIDIRKIRDEVEDSCLSDTCKKSLLSALKNAKKVK